MTATIEKQRTKTPSHVRDALQMVRDLGPEGMAAMEAALMELALVKLHLHKDEIRRAGKQAVKSNKTQTKKFYKALAKTRLDSGINAPEWIAKARKVTIPEYTRRDGTVVSEHERTLPKGHSPRAVKERADIRRELREAELSGKKLSRRQRRALDIIGEIDGMAQEFVEAKDNEVYSGAIQSFLSESKVGAGIVAAAEFLSRSSSRFQFAARAIAEFGPIAGARVSYAYFRYGGYDLPMREEGGQVKTELNDTLPKVESQKKTREWAIDRLKRRLPGQLAEDSEAEPPSEGFIIDKEGNILAHGVGRGNDHFLPFNSRHLRRMRQEEGVEYVRRRMYGGPTMEDFHAAMMMGADRLTVVSNGGLYTVSLTKRSHGLKMEHMHILQRFQAILDDKEGELNFKGYNSALATLQSEFPLHVRLDQAAKGRWDDRHDVIQPRNRFMEQLRKMFNALGGEQGADVGDTTSSGLTPQEAKRRYMPGIRIESDESPVEWFRRRVAQGADRDDLVRRARSYYLNYQRQDVPKWLKEEIQRKPSAHSYNDPAEARVPNQGATFVPPPRARERLTAAGFDPTGFRAENSAQARKLAERVYAAPESLWQEDLEDPEYRRELNKIFGKLKK